MNDTNTTTKPGVMAVMDSLCALAADPGAEIYGLRNKAKEANAIIASLAKALERALPTVEHMYHTNPDLDGSLWGDVVGCRAALAAFRGEA